MPEFKHNIGDIVIVERTTYPDFDDNIPPSAQTSVKKKCKGIIVSRSYIEDVEGTEIMYNVFFRDVECTQPYEERHVQAYALQACPE